MTNPFKLSAIYATPARQIFEIRDQAGAKASTTPCCCRSTFSLHQQPVVSSCSAFSLCQVLRQESLLQSTGSGGKGFLSTKAASAASANLQAGHPCAVSTAQTSVQMANPTFSRLFGTLAVLIGFLAGETLGQQIHTGGVSRVSWYLHTTGCKCAAPDTTCLQILQQASCWRTICGWLHQPLQTISAAHLLSRVFESGCLVRKVILPKLETDNLGLCCRHTS